MLSISLGDTGNILGGEVLGRQPFGSRGRWWEYNIKMNPMDVDKGKNSVVGAVTSYMLDGQGLILQWQVFLLHNIQTGFGAHLASYPVGTRDCFPGGKVD
jgi:hypothetical protein